MDQLLSMLQHSHLATAFRRMVRHYLAWYRSFQAWVGNGIVARNRGNVLLLQSNRIDERLRLQASIVLEEHVGRMDLRASGPFEEGGIEPYRVIPTSQIRQHLG